MEQEGPPNPKINQNLTSCLIPRGGYALVGKELLSEGKYEDLETVSISLFASTNKTWNAVFDLRPAGPFGLTKEVRAI